MFDTESKPRFGTLDGYRRKAMAELGYDEAESQRRAQIADEVVERFLVECRTDPDLPTYFKDEGARFEAWKEKHPYQARVSHAAAVACGDIHEFGEIESEVRDFYQSRVRQIVWLLKPETVAKVPNRPAWALIHIVQERIKRGKMI